MSELVGFVLAAVAIGAIGFAVGMLVAPRLSRVGDDEDGDADDHEEPR